MSDLKLGISADASQAQQAFAALAQASANLNDAAKALTDSTKKGAEETAKATVKWQELVNVAKAVTAAVVKYGVEAVKAYAEAERVQRQLQRAAGDYADVLGEQAEALSRLNRVDDDVIKQSAILLTQWGGAGAAARDVQQAVLDYAAAMGVDAVSATQDLIRNVESGGTGLAKLGVHFSATGDMGKDLAAAVEAIAKKFGGAAAADADSLVGQTHAAELAFEDFQKNVGGAIAEMVRATGIVPKLTKEIRELTDSLFTPTAKKKAESTEYIAQQVQYWEDIAAGNVVGYKDFATKTQFTFEEAQANLAQWRAKLRPDDFNVAPSTTPSVTGETNYGRKNAAALDEEKLDAEASQLTETLRQQTEEWEKNNAAVVGSTKGFESYVAMTKLSADSIKSAMPLYDDFFKQWEKNNKKAVEKSDEVMARWRRETNDANMQAEQQWGAMGDRIGAAFVDGLSTQLANLAQGGEFDVAIFVGDILASAVAIAGNVIGSALGQPAIGAAIGNLAGMGLRAGAAAISAGRKPKTKKYHEGGWVGDEISHLPRYHSGAWIGGDEQRAILQTGERVLSRREVGAMGGPAGVDAAAKGGGRGVTVHVHALDSKSAADSFVSDVGDGMRDAIRSGRGSLAPLLLSGVTPR